MSSLTQQELKSIYTEEDMLKGNINRMCVTHDRKELEDMHEYAIKRIDRIYAINARRFENDG